MLRFCSFVDVHCHLDALPAYCHDAATLQLQLESGGFNVVAG
jgi:hypothetical protein